MEGGRHSTENRPAVREDRPGGGAVHGPVGERHPGDKGQQVGTAAAILVGGAGPGPWQGYGEKNVDSPGRHRPTNQTGLRTDQERLQVTAGPLS